MKILSASVEDYLKAIHDLHGADPERRVSTSALAEALGVSSASVTGMLKKLHEAEPQLVDYKRYQGVRLTDAGNKIALEVIRHHRLIEAYLMEALGYTWDQVHQEADELEHVISEAFEAKIAEFLGHPEVDPHGDPIPDMQGRVQPSSDIALSELAVDQHATIQRVVDDPELLRYLDSLGLGLESRIEVTDHGPFGDLITLRVEGGKHEHTLSLKVADQVFVEVEEVDHREVEEA